LEIDNKGGGTGKKRGIMVNKQNAGGKTVWDKTRGGLGYTNKRLNTKKNSIKDPHLKREENIGERDKTWGKRGGGKRYKGLLNGPREPRRDGGLQFSNTRSQKRRITQVSKKGGGS